MALDRKSIEQNQTKQDKAWAGGSAVSNTRIRWVQINPGHGFRVKMNINHRGWGITAKEKKQRREYSLSSWGLAIRRAKSVVLGIPKTRRMHRCFS